MNTKILEAEIVEVSIPELELSVESTISIKSNFDEFKTSLDAKIASYKTTLETEEDFAQAKFDEKELTGIRKAIKKSRSLLLEQAGELNELLEGLDDSDELARTQQALFKKRIAAERERIKDEILADAYAVSKDFTPAMKMRIADSLKSKKTLESLKNAAAEEALFIACEIKAIDEILASFDESLRHGRAELLNKSPDAVTAELERRKQAQEAAIREAKLKEEAARLKAEAEKQTQERPKAEPEPEPEPEKPTQNVWQPKVDPIPVKSERPPAMDQAAESKHFLEQVPAIFAKFKEARLALEYGDNFDAAEEFAIKVNEAFLELKKQLTA